MDRVILVCRIFASQLQDDLRTTGMAVKEVGDLFFQLLSTVLFFLN